MAIIQGNTGTWEYVIGLEVHAQVISKSKLFSGAATTFGGEPNSQVSLVDAAMPGMLPVLNEFCVRQAVKTGLGLKAAINKKSSFDRKNYFYADLPQGYQISQFYHPIVGSGEINILLEDGSSKTVRIHHIHLEQDAGKSMHDQSPTSSFIDLNRAGVALMEIVSEPDMRSPYEAAEYVKKLRAILRYLETCDGDMEKGSMRCDANVSVRRPGEPFGTRCEIKNVNSVRNIMRAIEYEAMRQVEVLESGGTVKQETRLFDANNGTTRSMRSKEDAHDYRYFPDPDLLPVVLTDDYIAKVAEELPELPDAKIARYIKDFSLSNYDAEVLVDEKEVADFFEASLQEATDAKLVANWITGELFAYLNKAGLELLDSKITAIMIAKLVNLIKDGTISGKLAKQVFEIMTESGEMPEVIIEKHGLKQVSDTGAIMRVVEEVLAENADSVEGYLSGKDKLFGFFVGQIMKKTAGKASPGMVNDLLKEALEKRK